MKNIILNILIVLSLAACSSSNNETDGGILGDGAIGDGQLSGPLVMELFTEISEPLYPYNATKKSHVLDFQYTVRLTNNSEEDYRDLQAIVPVPDGIFSPSSPNVEEGWYNDVLREFTWYIDWFPPEQGVIEHRLTFERDPKLFSDDKEALKGDLVVTANGHIRQYEQKIVDSANEASITAYLPVKVSDQNVDTYAAAVDGTYLYVSTRPRSGDHANKGGIYRITLTTGDFAPIVQHAHKSDYRSPFILDGEYIYFADPKESDSNKQEIKKIKKDGSTTAETISLLEEPIVIRGFAVDNSALFVLLEKDSDPKRVVVRAEKQSTQNQLVSAGLGSFMNNTLAINSTHVFVLQTNPNAILKLDKTTLEIEKLVDLGSTTSERSLACNDIYCFWTEWNDGFLFQYPLAGGEKKKLTSTNQPIVLVDELLFSGINGLVSVGQDGYPLAKRIFELGGPIPVFCADGNYVYFQHNDYLWKIHR